MNRLLTLGIVLTLFGCQEKKEEKKIDGKYETERNTFFVGTYTDTESEGIYKYTLNNDGSLENNGLVARSSNPSFLTKSFNNKYLLAVNENNIEGTGTVESYLIEDDTLKFINRKSSGGAHPCFVAINEANNVLTANYTGGNVGLLKLKGNGKLQELLDVKQHIGQGSTERQEAPHAHSAWFEPNSNTIIAVDLGTNELWFYQLDSINQKLAPTNQGKLKMDHGGGPRHLTFHPNGKWLYVLNELKSEIQLVSNENDSIYKTGITISSLPNGYSEPNTGADIHISSDGNFLYSSNRGHNSIAIFKVNDEDGSLTLIANESTKGDSPRNFSLSPDENYLLVANQNTNNIVSYKRDKMSGLLTYIDQIDALKPVCILFN